MTCRQGKDWRRKHDTPSHDASNAASPLSLHFSYVLWFQQNMFLKLPELLSAGWVLHPNTSCMCSWTCAKKAALSRNLHAYIPFLWLAAHAMFSPTTTTQACLQAIMNGRWGSLISRGVEISTLERTSKEEFLPASSQGRFCLVTSHQALTLSAFRKLVHVFLDRRSHWCEWPRRP